MSRHLGAIKIPDSYTGCFLLLLVREGKRGEASFSDYPSILFGTVLPERAVTFHIQLRNKTRHTKTPRPLGVKRELRSLDFGASVISKLKKSHGKKLPVIS